MKYWLPPLITVAVTLGVVVFTTNDCAYQPIWKPVGAYMVRACP